MVEERLVLYICEALASSDRVKPRRVACAFDCTLEKRRASTELHVPFIARLTLREGTNVDIRKWTYIDWINCCYIELIHFWHWRDDLSDGTLIC